MHSHDLKSLLTDAADAEPTTDPTAGRRSVERRVRRHQTRRNLGVLAAAVLIVALVLGASRIGRTNVIDTITDNVGVPKLVPGFVPDGLHLVNLTTQPVGVVPSFDLHTTVYVRSAGPAGATVRDDELRDASFAVVQASSLPSATVPGTGNDPSPGSYRAPESWATADGMHVVVEETRGTPSRTLGVESRSLDEGRLRSILAGLTLRADRSVEAASVPPGYRAVVTDSPSTYAFGTYGNDLAHDGYLAEYDTARPPGSQPISSQMISPTLRLTVQRGSVADLQVMRFGFADPSDTTVRGHPALAGRLHDPTRTDLPESANPSGTIASNLVELTTLAWFEDDGTLVTVDSATFDQPTLEHIAEGLRIDPAGWDQLQQQLPPTTRPAGCPIGVPVASCTVYFRQPSGTSLTTTGTCVTDSHGIETCRAKAQEIDPQTGAPVTGTGPPTTAPCSIDANRNLVCPAIS